MRPSTIYLQVSTHLHIRPMRPDDLDQVQAIDRISFNVPWPESSFRYELLENPHSLLLVAEDLANDQTRRVVGVIVVWLIEDEAHIATISIHPDYRGQGISRELLAAALLESIRQGTVLATLEVRANNLIAQALYRKFRFDVAGRRARYYRDNQEDALIMTVVGLDENYARWLSSGEWKK